MGPSIEDGSVRVYLTFGGNCVSLVTEALAKARAAFLEPMAVACAPPERARATTDLTEPATLYLPLAETEVRNQRSQDRGQSRRRRIVGQAFCLPEAARRKADRKPDRGEE